MSNDVVADLAEGIRGVLGAREVSGLHRLSGGASRETWRFRADNEDFVLQRVRQGTPIGLRGEVSVLSAAFDAGVPVPELVIDGSGRDDLERPFMIVRAVEGETIARKILRDDTFARAREILPTQMGTALAQLHRIDPACVPDLEEEDQIKRYRQAMDAMGEPHPVFEAAFRWLEQNIPASGDVRVVHGDFRLGNLMVNEEGLVAILDWELAHLGDPMEDLGWVCVRAWRFGGDQPVAGIGTYEALFEAYERESGIRPDVDVVRWWEILGTLKWGIICISQAHTHLNGIVRSHELAAIGRRVCENEYDLIELLLEDRT